jgi:hypothetical protein
VHNSESVVHGEAEDDDHRGHADHHGAGLSKKHQDQGLLVVPFRNTAGTYVVGDRVAEEAAHGDENEQTGDHWEESSEKVAVLSERGWRAPDKPALARE